MSSSDHKSVTKSEDLFCLSDCKTSPVGQLFLAVGYFTRLTSVTMYNSVVWTQTANGIKRRLYDANLRQVDNLWWRGAEDSSSTLTVTNHGVLVYRTPWTNSSPIGLAIICSHYSVARLVRAKNRVQYCDNPSYHVKMLYDVPLCPNNALAQ